MAYGPYGKIHRLVNDYEQQDMERGLMPGTAYMMGLRLSPLSTRSGTAAEIVMIDNERIAFGSSTDFTVSFDATNLVMAGASERVGTFNITNVEVRIGAFSSTTQGSGIPLSHTNTGAFRVYGDDNGTVMASGSVPDVKVGLFRNLLTADHDAVNVRQYGVMGQIKASGTARWGNEQVAATYGYVEINSDGSATLDDYGVTSGLMACIETAGNITVGANHVLAGSAVISKLGYTGAVTETGITTGYYVGLYDTTNWSDSTSVEDWIYGLYIDTDAVATGIFLGTATTGIALSGTFTTGIDFTSATITPDSSRTNSCIAIGDRLGEKTVTMAASNNYHLDPVQININIAGANPTNSSTVNNIYQNITHDTTDMTNLRIKCADWNIAVAKNVKDVYVYQGEIDFSGTSTVNSEAAVMGLTLNAGTGTLSGNLYGQIIVTTGSSLPAATSSALFLSHRGGTLTRSLYIECNSSQTITNGIYMNAAGNITNAIAINGAAQITNFLDFDAAAGCIAADTSALPANATHKITCDVGGTAFYLIGVADF